MLILAATLLGAILGWHRAARAGGNRLDQLQYAAAHGIAFCLLAVILVVVLGRMGVS